LAVHDVTVQLLYLAHTTSLAGGGPPGRGGLAGLDPSNPQVARLIRGNHYYTQFLFAGVIS